MKLTKHAVTLLVICLIVVIALMILIPFERTATWWISAACTIAMFGVCAGTFVSAFRRDNKLESKLLGWPIFKVGFIAWIVQLIAGGILMGIAAFCPVRVAVVAELIVFAVTGICLTFKDAARTVVVRGETGVADRSRGWKAIRAKACALEAGNADAGLRRLSEEIRFADPIPTALDGRIDEMLDVLARDASPENINKALTLVLQRKAAAKQAK